MKRSQNKISRREAIRTLGATGAAFLGLASVVQCDWRLLRQQSDPLLQRDPAGRLDLPPGFRYRILASAGDAMDDGCLRPNNPDGMFAFPLENKILLMCNHELGRSSDWMARPGAFGSNNRLWRESVGAPCYDPGQVNGKAPLGAVTALLLDAASLQPLGSRLALYGTLRNCGGGASIRQSWISCEEAVDRSDAELARDHGYAFEISASWPPPSGPARRLEQLGRFHREAIVWDQSSDAIYQTEDREDGLWYRFLATRRGQPESGGRLQALALVGEDRDLRNQERIQIAVGEERTVRWIELQDVEAPQDDLRHRGRRKGALAFARGEGMWQAQDRSIYFSATSGGPRRIGQIWRYRPSPYEGISREREAPARLQLFYESQDESQLDSPDNLCVAPWGDLLVCEDGGGIQWLRSIAPDGSVRNLARYPTLFSELAGACFSPDGRALFLNLYREGLTIAIEGPFPSAAG